MAFPEARNRSHTSGTYGDALWWQTVNRILVPKLLVYLLTKLKVGENSGCAADDGGPVQVPK